MNDERRIKLLRLKERDLEALITRMNGKYTFNITSGPLDGIEIVSSFYDYWTECYMVRIRHDSFPVLEEGARPEVVDFVVRVTPIGVEESSPFPGLRVVVDPSMTDSESWFLKVDDK